MNKILFIFLSLPVFCHAQISIGQADMPSAGDTLRVSNTLTILDPLLTDTNYTWDYAYLKPVSQWLQRFDAPAAFPGILSLLFGTASYGNKQYTPDSIPGTGIKMEAAYAVYKKSATNLKETGYGLSINSLPVPFAFNPADVIYKFPLAYGNKDSSDSKFSPVTFGIKPPFYYGQHIHRVNEVDGWGTLTTPYGSFQTLRVKSTLAVRDTFADSTGAGFAFSRPLQYEFKWLMQNGKIPYLQVNAINTNGTPMVTQITYRDSLRDSTIQLGIKEQREADFGLLLFPNPASEYVCVQYTLDKREDVKMELLDMTGKKIRSLKGSAQNAGTHIEIINLRNLNLSGGSYFICLYAGRGKALGKFILQ
jgi:Secretion system C-terminal sorting domain